MSHEDCRGPCLPHCVRPRPRSLRFLTSLSVVHAVASLVYLVLTSGACGTPFADSLTEDQRALKRAASVTRARAYAMGLLVGLAVLPRVV